MRISETPSPTGAVTKVAILGAVDAYLNAAHCLPIFQTGEPRIKHFRCLNCIHVNECILWDTIRQSLVLDGSGLQCLQQQHSSTFSSEDNTGLYRGRLSQPANPIP
jgi:hypothetical protein